jgi:hypothetical protein
MAGGFRALVRAPRYLLLSVVLAAAALFGVAVFGAPAPVADAAGSRYASQYLMCNWMVQPRTQTVYIDPSSAGTGVSKAQVLAAFDAWNKLFVKYHGFPIFVEHKGPASTADIVIDAHTSQRTWVDGHCDPAYKSVGKSHTTVYLGVKDKWRNATMIAHEIGHALGFADHGTGAQHVAGHIGFKSCGNYYGVMSYCNSNQNWFMDIDAPGIYLDGQLVRDYWN